MMSKKYKGLFASLAASVVLMTSCKKDYLDTAPTNAISEATALSTITNCWSALNGMHRLMYSQFYSTQSLGGQSANMIFVDALGEDLVMTGQSNGWFINEYKWISHRTANSTINKFNYLFYYTFISNANMLIENIDKAIGDDADRKEIKGQAYAYRAWAYYQMVQLFGERFVKGQPNSGLGVPIILKSRAGAVPRNTVAEVYAQINADLNEATTLLTGAPVRANASHLNLAVVQGIRARVALTTQEWELAATSAVAARTGFNLMDSTAYMAGFNDYNNSEWIWGAHQQADQTTYFYSFFAFMSVNYNSTNIRTNPKAINSLLYSKISKTDVRKNLWDSTAKNTAFKIPPQGSRFAYMNRKFQSAGGETLSTGDVPIMRSSEMYLIEAEARARLAQDGLAATALFAVAKARDRAATLSTQTGTALLDEILLQRRIELWGEGFRFYDLKRTNAPLNRDGANHNGALASIFAVPAGDIKWQFLIPQEEINNTRGVVIQNPQ